MSQYVPDSTVTFYQVEGLDTKTGRTLAFANAAERESFMATKKFDFLTSVNVQVVKKRFQTIRVNLNKMMPGGNDVIQYCNYLSFINPSYGNKIYYCNITNYDYINNETLQITYSIDWWMTDMFIADIEACSILREGFTNGEFNTLKDNPYQDVVKMRTEEPLACNSETEPLRLRVANDNAMCNVLKGNSNYFDGWEVFKQNDAVYANGNQYEWDGNSVNTNYANTTPFYILSFVSSAANEQGSSETLRQNVWRDLKDQDVNPGRPYLFVTDKTWSDGDYPCPNYGQAKTYVGGGTSTSTYPLHDTTLPRPYCMAGTSELSTLYVMLETFETLDCVSAILSVQAVPMFMVDEFIPNAFDNPASDVRNSAFLKVPFPQAYRTKKNSYVNNVHPKLYRFPFSYASLDGVNDSGHVELQFEKIGSYDPLAEVGATVPQYPGGPRLDANGKPSYFVLQKYVSITADGIYAGVCPVDYDKRIDGTNVYNGSGIWYAKSDLTHGVFYTDFPQVPYTTDAYYEFLGSMAKQQILANTAQQRMVEENAYGAATGSQFTNFISGILGAGANLIGGAVSALSKGDISGMVSGGLNAFTGGLEGGLNSYNNKAKMQEMEYQTELRKGAESYMSNPQEPNAISENWSRAKNAFVAPNYHTGSCGGVLNLLNGTEGIGVNFNMHMRSEDFLNKYSQFLNLYGMATKEFKKPAITKFLEGTPSDAAAPRFYRSSDNIGYCPIDRVFYTQTENAHVTMVCSESSQYIENLLNGGVQFIEAVTAHG